MSDIVNPRFEEPEYKGQDVVHEGIRIPLQVPLDEILTGFDKTALQFCQENSLHKYIFEPLQDKHLKYLRAMWFDPEDKTFPDEVGDRIGWTCRRVRDGVLLGGIILSPAGKNLFLHQLVASDTGKQAGAPTRLIWHAVRQLRGKEWHSIDVGVSYNPKRYAFFKHFAVETYPVILKKPFYVPVLRLSPFRSFLDAWDSDNSQHAGWSPEAPFTLATRGSYALLALLKHLGLGYADDVTIVKTFGSNYITKCVTNTIEKVAGAWQLRNLTASTKVVLAIHEFGIPVYQDRDMSILEEARSKHLPIIEDCAWRTSKVFDFSDYQIYSFQKMFNINYGGAIAGVEIPDEKMWEYGCHDFVKKGKLLEELPSRGDDIDIRIRNWKHFDDLVRADGMEPDDCYKYREAIDNNIWSPTVYLLKVKDEQESVALVDRLREFGVQAGVYWGEPVVFLPIHGNMSLKEVEYMFAVVKGYYNLCHDYGSKK